MFYEICNPNVNTGPLRRCPFTENNPCSSDNPDWPTIREVNDLIAIDTYDAPPYNILTGVGYRTHNDFDIRFNLNLEECRDDRMCTCKPGGPDCPIPAITFKSKLHTDVCI